MKLQDTTGMTDIDPIHRFMGLIDEFASDIDWTDTRKKFTEQELVEILLSSEHSLKGFKELELFLSENLEFELSKIVRELPLRLGREGLDLHGICVSLMYIFVNLDLLEERYLESPLEERNIYSNWKPSKKD